MYDCLDYPDEALRRAGPPQSSGLAALDGPSYPSAGPPPSSGLAALDGPSYPFGRRGKILESTDNHCQDIAFRPLIDELRFTTNFDMRYLILLLFFPIFSAQAQSGKDAQQVLSLVQQFFDALEEQDTASLREMFLKDAHNYAVWKMKDSVVVRGQTPAGIRFKADQIIKERMREASTVVKVEGNIAMVWAPYDLWVNDIFSHCGVDVFTMINSSQGWKIASVSYTIEKVKCK
jgi:hypothetical protein